MKSRILIGLVLFMLLLSACQTASPSVEPDTAPTNPPSAESTAEVVQPTEEVVEVPTDAVDEEVVEEPTEAQTEATPEPTAAPIREGSQSALVTNYGCDGEFKDFANWCLLYGGNITDIPVTELPANSRVFPEVYAFAPSKNRLLLGLSDWVGVGPANFAATDLWLGSNPEDLNLTPLIYNSTVVNAQLSSDGQLIAYLSATDLTYDLHLLNLNTASDVVIASDVTPAFNFSPDGSQIAFARDSEWTSTGDDFGLFIITLESGAESRVPIDMQDVDDISIPYYWSPDGQKIVILVRIINEDVNAWKYMVYDLSNGSSSEITFASSAAGLYAGEMVDPGQVTPVLWAENGSSFIATVSTGIMTSEWTVWVLQYNLDPALEVITSIDVVAEHAELAGWDLPGEAVWVVPTEKNEAAVPFSVDLP